MYYITFKIALPASGIGIVRVFNHIILL